MKHFLTTHVTRATKRLRVTRLKVHGTVTSGLTVKFFETTPPDLNLGPQTQEAIHTFLYVKEHHINSLNFDVF